MACGFTTWAMVEWEADDALAAAAAVADADPRVEQVLIVTPDKDLGQCVRGTRVVQYDRRKDEIVDEAGGRRRSSVCRPASIADYLALVGDSADGFPGPARLGREERRHGAGQVRHASRPFPPSSGDWGLPGLRGAEKLARTLQRPDGRCAAVQGDRHGGARRAGGHGRRLAVAGPTAGVRGRWPHGWVHPTWPTALRAWRAGVGASCRWRAAPAELW